MSDDRPIEVAIIGGGCAAISTAFELTRPEHQGRYRVTVYQVGWRLGGKGASGRGPAGRIEEHGLHIWLGFYENAFRLLRECYKELGRRPGECPIADWRDAFDPDPWVGVADKSKDEWKKWLAYFPPGEGSPGDPFREHNPFSVRGYMGRSAQLLRTLLVAVQSRHTGSDAQGSPASEVPLLRPEAVAEAIARILKYGQLATFAAIIEAVELLRTILSSVPVLPQQLVIDLMDAIGAGAQRQIEQLIDEDDEVRRLWELIDLSLAILRGLVRFNVANDPRGFDAVNDYDCREWLLLNGASQASVDSAICRGLYDLAFAYEDGDFSRPALAAGQGIRGSVRMFFTYRGSLFWKMRAGMGDVVFAPFYEVLSRRGVRFEFFHRLRNVKLADRASLGAGEKPYVEALEFDVQAKTKSGGEYQPLVDVRGLPSWSAEPDWDQLKGGKQKRREGWRFESHWDDRKVDKKVLKVVDDFDFVVLGVGVGAVPHVAGELVESDPRWRSMVQNVKTVATQAFQVWMDEDMEELGWEGPPTTLSAFVTPFDTWADMRQLIPYENWPDDPRSIAYFCCVLPTPGVPADATERLDPDEYREQVRRNAIRFLNKDVDQLWPKAVHRPGRFRWELLLAADEKSGKKKGKSRNVDEARFDTQFWTANVNPSDRYVLALPGSLKYRISPLDTTYDNLTIAGDWTDCGFNEGCVEAAVMSGRLAAHAISTFPRLEDIVGYDHP